MLREFASKVHFDQVDRQPSAAAGILASRGVGVSAGEIVDLLGSVGPLGVWRLEISTGLMYWNPDVFLIHGLPVSDEPVSLAGVLSCYHPEDAVLVEQLIESVSAGHNGFRYVMRIGAQPDGYKLVALAGRYREANGGELIGYCHELPALVRSVVLARST